MDLEKGSEEVVELPEGVFASETVMAPRVGSDAEDDGYLVDAPQSEHRHQVGEARSPR